MTNPHSKPSGFPQAVLTFGSTVLLTTLAITGGILGLRGLGSLAGMELGAFDWLMRSRPDEGVDNRFLVVGINDADIQTRKEYPIEDGTLAQVLSKLEAQAPRVIGIDILRDVKQGSAKGRAELVKILTDNDNIVAVCAISKAESPGIAAAPGIPEDRVGVADFPVDRGGTVRQGMILTIPQASKLPVPSEHICNYANSENQLPSLSFQVAARYLNEDGIAPEPTPKGEIKFGNTVLRRLTPNAGSYHKVDTGDYQMLLNYRSAKNAVKQVSLSDVLADKVQPDLIKDKIVLIGYTAAIVKDTFYTPYSGGADDSQKMPGVVVHAQNASQILSAVLNKRPLFWYWNEAQEGFWVFGWSLVGGILAWRIRKPWLLILGGGVAIAILLGGTYLIFLQAGWIPLVPPALGLLTTAAGVVLIDRYAATIVKTVKGFLKINIEIDKEKKDEEVAAITESDYFVELQQKAKDLRVRDNSQTSNVVGENSPTSDFHPQEDIHLAPTIQPKLELTPNILEVDYLQAVRDRRNKNQSSEQTQDQNNQSVEPTSNPIEEQEDVEYWQQLQNRGKKLRENKK
ncbi:transmembrane sensor domain protein [Nostoc sp. CENA543]|uniref:CHASE2 domain-containing protein n=1 Tax=Nostoc sp. CENA543 TaxID=1869241 RepID=UPI000CA286E2|nr:CHASE2 domain-containing protein [Nostoc sp. CENA543]AUT04413.1 transmembrane sensor domain protein [Nostoc sp. CENA543]